MPVTYKIGEAAALLNLKTYVLRFWETEFPEIVPLRTEKGQRLYTKEHLALLERIRYLLHDRGLTIGGARKVLAEEKARGVIYAYGASPAVAGDAMRGGRAPDSPAPLDVSDPGDGTGDFTSGGEPCLQAPGENGGTRLFPQAGFALSSPVFPLRPGGVKQRSQGSLPGLDQIVALREAIAAEKMEAAGGAEQSLPGNASPERMAQGMLPLFAVVRSAFLAGKAAGAGLPGKGGDNFIQAGTDAALAAPAATPSSLSPSPHAPPSPAGAPREDLRRLALELEEVAGILRAHEPAAPATGGCSPESS